MFEESLTFLFFLITNFITKCYYNMIIIHTYVTNPLYFLIIKLYKVILYIFILYTHIFTQIILKKNE